MRFKFLCILLLITLAVVLPLAAQDTPPQSCDAASIQQAVDELTASYSADNGGSDGAAALEAATTLRDSLNSLVEGCSVVPEATPAPEATASAGMPIAGQWFITWEEEGTFACPNNPDYTVKRYNRPIILRYENDRIITEDIFVWPTLEFDPRDDGSYFYRRNVTLNDSSTLSFEYTLLTFEPDQIDGTSITFYERIDCSLEGKFTLSLQAPDIFCMVANEQGSNLRGGPGTNFDRVGKMGVEEPVNIVAQAAGDDGQVWWQLADDAGWVRSDLVEETTLCDSVPTVDVP